MPSLSLQKQRTLAMAHMTMLQLSIIIIFLMQYLLAVLTAPMYNDHYIGLTKFEELGLTLDDLERARPEAIADFLDWPGIGFMDRYTSPDGQKWATVFGRTLEKYFGSDFRKVFSNRRKYTLRRYRNGNVRHKWMTLSGVEVELPTPLPPPSAIKKLSIAQYWELQCNGRLPNASLDLSACNSSMGGASTVQNDVAANLYTLTDEPLAFEIINHNFEHLGIVPPSDGVWAHLSQFQPSKILQEGQDEMIDAWQEHCDEHHDWNPEQHHEVHNVHDLDKSPTSTHHQSDIYGANELYAAWAPFSRRLDLLKRH